MTTYIGVQTPKVEPQREKIQCLVYWPIPKSQTEAFIGLCNYYRRFIKGYTEIADPLIKLMNLKNYNWRDEHGTCFNRAIESIITWNIGKYRKISENI